MKIFNKIEMLSHSEQKTAVALGTFDGLHVGHKKVIEHLLEVCKEKNLRSVVYTFSNHPREYTNKDKLPNRILTLKEKIIHFEELGIDELVLIEFDDQQMNMSAHDFIETLLLKQLNMEHLIVGFNFHFGKGAEGNVPFLKSYAQSHHFDLSVIEGVHLDGELVSSSRIRKLLKQGNIEKTNDLLGRLYTVSGQVIKGKQVGTKLGFPTANLSVSPNMTLLKSGVYVTQTQIGDNLYKSVTNVGFNPTFDQNEFNLETFVFDFSDNLYDSFIEVQFLHRLRDEIKYDSLDALKKQINMDVEDTNAYFKRLQE